MHSAGIIHRDLKPANILINSNSQIRVADFGLSRLVNQQQSNSFIMTENIATRWYRAPQILLGSSNYTKSVDIWSIGCILGQMIYGKAILRGKTSFQQITLVVNLLGRPTKQDLQSIESNVSKQILQNIKTYGNEKILTLESLTKSQNSDLTDFLKRTLVYNPNKRITLEEAFQHPYVKCFFREDQLKKFEGKISLSLNDNTKFSIGRYRKMLYEAVGISEQTPSRKISIIPSYSLLRSEKRDLKSISNYKEKSRDRYLSTNNKIQLNKVKSITNISRKKSENQIRKGRNIKMISKSPDMYYSKFVLLFLQERVEASSSHDWVHPQYQVGEDIAQVLQTITQKNIFLIFQKVILKFIQNMEVLIMRHAQSQFNQMMMEFFKNSDLNDTNQSSQEFKKFKFDTKFLDCGITQKGIEECQMAKKLLHNQPIGKQFSSGLIIVSPLKRALLTCQYVFEGHKYKPQIIVDPLFRQIIQSSCDLGQGIEENIKRFNFNWSQFQKFVGQYPKKMWTLLQVLDKQRQQMVWNELNKYNKNEWGDKVNYVMNQIMANNKISFFDQNKWMRERSREIKKKLKEYYLGKLEWGKKLIMVGHSRTIKYMSATVFSEDDSPLNSYSLNNCDLIKLQI